MMTARLSKAFLQFSKRIADAQRDNYARAYVMSKTYDDLVSLVWDRMNLDGSIPPPLNREDEDTIISMML